MSAKIIIALAGEIASGKGEVVKILLKEYGVGVVRFSDCLRNILDRLHIKKSRENMQSLSTSLRNHFGKDILSRVVLVDVKSLAPEMVVLDGVRRIDDISMLLNDPDIIFHLIYIEAGLQARFERLKKRNENHGDADKSFDDFVRDQAREAEAGVVQLKAIAGNVIVNEGSAEELRQKVIEVIKSLR